MNLSGSEVIIVLVIALLVFGPNRLPEMARQLGRGIRELRGQMNAVTDRIDLDAEPPARATADARAVTPAPDAAPTVELGAPDVAAARMDDEEDLLDGVVVSGDTPPASDQRG